VAELRGWLVALRRADWRSIDGVLLVLAFWTVLGQAAYPLGWLISESRQTGYSAVDNYVSDLGAQTATDPWIMNAGFILFGASFVTLAVALARTLPRSRARTVAAVWFAATGVAIGSVAFFQEDCWSTTDQDCWTQQQAGALSWHHYAHVHMSGVFGLLVWLSPLVLWFALPRGVLRKACGVCAVFGSAVFLAVLALPMPGGGSGPAGGQGLVERLAATVMNGWVLTLVGVILAARALTRQAHVP
jgi:hypothetical protein